MKTSFLLIAVLFIAFAYSGCNTDDGTNTEYPDVIATEVTVTGTLKYRQSSSGASEVVNWPYGTATFKAILGADEVLASATVNADGTFTLVLPATVPGFYLNSLTAHANGQGGNVQATPETVRLLSTIQYKVDYTSNGTPKSFLANLHTLNADLTISKSYFFNFYDRDGSLNGTGSTGNTFDWTFTKGWGFIELYKISGTSEAFVSKSIASLPATAIWLN